jgi:maltooligosyltrehalose trehalohydrolase
MPLCPFPGRHGWGYEGVSLWAVHEPYGGPEALKRFVDRAHELGLGVVLDVVHNHLGPSGNHLPAFGPYFTDTHQTPWGSAVNLDAPGSDEVRAYLVGSALAWLRDYRLDGLRLDAVHALRDTRAVHFLEELSAAVDALAGDLGRPLFLIAESDLNDPRLITSREEGGLGLHAQWNDDFHHALHTTLTGEAQGYYADFAHPPLTALCKTLTSGFFHNGTYSSFRGRRHGRPLDRARVSAQRLLGYTQTHDQIGNRAQGDRLSASLSPGLPRRSRRCSSWARSGVPRPPGSSSPTTPTPSSPRPCGGAGGGSSRRTAGPRRTCRIRRTRRPGTARVSTGPNPKGPRTRACWPGTAT